MKIRHSSDKNRFSKSLRMILCFLFLSLLSAQTITAKDSIRVGNFSDSTDKMILPEKWEPLTFNKISRQTQYSLINDNGTFIVEAISEQSASGIIRKIRIDPEQYPVIKWQWKISNIYRNGDITKKAGDDCPARIFITFEYDYKNIGFFEQIKFAAAKLIFGEDTPFVSINYIWASSAPEGTLTENPYTENLQMFVVQSGDKEIHTWIQEERNVYQDFIRAFGKKPPMISGIGIMTDSDNTGENTVSYYGDIILESR